MRFTDETKASRESRRGNGPAMMKVAKLAATAPSAIVGFSRPRSWRPRVSRVSDTPPINHSADTSPYRRIGFARGGVAFDGAYNFPKNFPARVTCVTTWRFRWILCDNASRSRRNVAGRGRR